MSSERDYLVFERRHLAYVTRVLRGALYDHQFPGASLMEFYRSAVAYIAFNINRLVMQDGRLADLIQRRIGDSDLKLNETVATVYKRLDTHRQHTAMLLAAMAEFERVGPEGQAEFENKARLYLEYRDGNRGQQHALASWREQVIEDKDWSFVAAMSDAEVEAQSLLFERVRSTAPGEIIREIEAQQV